MAIKSFLSEGGFSVGSVGSAPIEVIDSSGNITAVGLTVSGNLVVNGSTTTINSTTTTLDDPIFTLGGDTVPTSDDNKDRGIEFRWHDGSLAKVGFFGFDDSTGKFVFIPNATNTSEVFSGTVGAIDLSGSLSGGTGISFNGSTGAITNTGVTSITGTSNQVTASASTGAITLSLPQNIHVEAQPTFGTLTAYTFYLRNNNTNYIDESYGFRFHQSSGAHPVQFEKSIRIGAINASGTDYGSGNVYALGSGYFGSSTAATSTVIINAAQGAAQGGAFGIQGAGTWLTGLGTRAAIIGSGTDQSTMLQSYADNVFIHAVGSTKAVYLQINSTNKLIVDNTSTTVAGNLTVQGTGDSTIAGTLGIGGAAYYSAKFTVDGSSIGYSWGVTNTRGGHITTVSNPDGGTTASNIAFRVNNSSGTTLLQSTYSGAVTIPSTLTVNGAEAAVYGADGYQLKLGYNSTYYWKIGRSSAGTLIFNDSAGDRISFTNTGRLGIGTTTPESILQLGNYTGNPELTFAAVNNGVSKINFYDNNSTEGVYIKSSGEAYGGQLIFGARWDDDEDKIVFKMYQVSGGASYHARVGIGTTSPTQGLHLNGGVLRISGGATGHGEINLDSGTEYDGWQVRKESSTMWGVKSVTSGNDLAIFVDNTTARGVYIKSGGNVGINQTNPSHKLDVGGSIRTTDWLYIENSGYGMYSNASGLYLSTAGNNWDISSGAAQTWAGLRLYTGGKNVTWRGHFYGDSAGQGFLDSSGNWALQLDSSKRLQVYSGVYSIENGTIRVFNPGGATYSDGPALTGAFKIKLPTATYNSNTMMTLVVDIYNYDTGKSLRFRVGGYNYQTGDWYNTFAEQTSDLGVAAYNVRFGSDGTSNCIWIGETNSSWSYPKVYVSEFLGGHGSATAAWASGWAITRVTAFDTVGTTRSASVTVNSNNVGTYSITPSNYTSTLDSRYLRGDQTNPGTPGNFNFSVGTSGTYSFIQSHASTPLYLNPVGNNVIIASSSANNLGVGTTGPDHKITAEDSSANGTRIAVNNTGNAAAGAGIYMRTYSGASLVSNATLRTNNAGSFELFTGTSGGTLAITVNSSQNTTLAGNLTVNGTVTTLGTANGSNYILTPGTDTSTGVLALQAGQGSAGFGGGLAMFSGTHATYPGWTIAGLASGVSTAKFAVNSQGWVGAGTNVFTVDRSGNTVANGTLIVSSTTDATAAPAGSISASGGIAVGTNKKFMATGTGGYWGAPSVGNQETLLIRATGFGYNPTSYAGVQIGGTAGRSIVFGVDVSAIAGSQFTGAANEWIIPNTLNIRQVTSAGTDFSSAIFTIGNGGATTIGGNLTVSGTGTSSFAGSVNVDGGINFLRGSGEYSTYIKANDYIDGGYNGSTLRYWIELGAKGGTHIVLNTDGSATSAENAYDHFTIWQAVNGTGAIAAGARKFWITNTGRVNFIDSVWHKSSDGIERIHFGSSGTTFYKGGGTGTIHTFRNASDVDILTLSNAKDAILSGNLAVNGGTGTIDATSGTASATLNLVGRSSGTAKTASIASNSAGSLLLSAEGAGSALGIAANTGNTTVAYNLTVNGTGKQTLGQNVNATVYAGNSATTDQAIILSNTRRANYGDVMIAKNLEGVASADSYATPGTTAATGYAAVEMRYGGVVRVYGNSGATTAAAVVAPNVLAEFTPTGIGLNLNTSVTGNLTVSGTGTINGTSIPASKTLVVTTDKLSVHAATTSAELAGVISDETGTGALVFANTPTLVTPNIGAATGTSVNLTGSGTFGTVAVSGLTRINSSPNAVLSFYNAGVSEWTIGQKTSAFVINNGGNFAGTDVVTISGSGATSLSGNLTVGGNLIVNGTTTTVDSTTLTTKDPIITLGGGSAGTAATVDDNKDRGIEFKWYTGSTAKTGFFGFDDSTGYFTFIPDATNTSEVFSGTQGDIQAGVYRGTGASLTGSITESSADDQAITLNATDNSWKYLGFQWSGTRKAYFGINASGSPEWGSDVANATFAIVGSGSSLTIAGNTVLHGGNYNNYTDPIIQALDSKASVKAATTADITLSGTQTIDGVALVAGDRVLVKNQNTQTPNGIYVVSAGAWTRATDFDTWAKLIGAFVFVEQGSTNGLTGWLCAAAAGGAFGSNPIMFSQFSHGGSVNAGTGLTKTTNNVGSGPVSTFSIANTTVSPTSYGSASSVATFTVNAQGQLTAASSVAIAISSAAVSGLANSATTTATSANTANQIVLRDGSGNFSAGTITAALSGNATTATSASNITGGNQTGNYQVTSGQYTRFGHANQTDTNDGVIGAGIFASGLNIVGTQTVAAQGRVVRVWGNLMRDDGTQYVYNSGSWGINITGTASSETLSTVTGRGASTGSQISVATGSGGSMFTGTKVGSGYSDGVSGATFKSITDNPNGGSTAFAAYYGGSAGTNSFFVGAAGNAYFKDVVGIGTTSPVANLHVYRATNSTVGNLAEVATYSAVKIGKFRADQDHSLYIGNAGSYASFLQGANDAGSNSMNILINPFGSNVGIGTTSPGYKLEVNGSFAATTKSFVIKHPTKEGKKLRYGSLEGPENGVYVRGKLKGSNVIELPDYWTKLVDPESITVQLTPIGSHQKLYVEKIMDNKVYIANENLLAKAINCFFYVLAERCDVEKLEVEIDA